MTDAALLSLLALLPIVCASAVTDLRFLRIPNTHVLAAIAVFAVTAPFVLTWPELGFRCVAAACAFAVGAVLFALRMFGGGDVKMLAAVLLFVPSTEHVLFLRLFAGSLLLTSIGIMALQRLPVGEKLGWESHRLQGHVPVGVAIAISVGLLTAFALVPA